MAPISRCQPGAGDSRIWSSEDRSCRVAARRYSTGTSKSTGAGKLEVGLVQVDRGVQLASEQVVEVRGRELPVRGGAREPALDFEPLHSRPVDHVARHQRRPPHCRARALVLSHQIEGSIEDLLRPGGICVVIVGRADVPHEGAAGRLGPRPGRLELEPLAARVGPDGRVPQPPG
jgi:hypothetical protein